MDTEYRHGLDVLERRVEELRSAYLARLPDEHVDGAYRALSSALDALTTTAENGYAGAIGPLDGLSPTRAKEVCATAAARRWQRRVVEARRARQAHLLSAGPAAAVRVPASVPTDGSVPLGPFWPLLDHLHITEQAPRRPVPRGHVAPVVPLPAQRRPAEPATDLALAAEVPGGARYHRGTS